MLQIFNFSGNGNLADCEFLRRREEKFRANLKEEMKKTRAWLIAHGCKVRGENEG